MILEVTFLGLFFTFCCQPQPDISGPRVRVNRNLYMVSIAYHEMMKVNTKTSVWCSDKHRTYLRWLFQCNPQTLVLVDILIPHAQRSSRTCDSGNPTVKIHISRTAICAHHSSWLPFHLCPLFKKFQNCSWCCGTVGNTTACNASTRMGARLCPSYPTFNLTHC